MFADVDRKFGKLFSKDGEEDDLRGAAQGGIEQLADFNISLFGFFFVAEPSFQCRNRDFVSQNCGSE